MNITEKIYTTLCVLLIILGVVGNITYQKFISLNFFNLMTIEVSAGALFYPFTFMITNIITEFCGEEKAAFSIWLSIVMNLSVAAFLMGIDQLPATVWSNIDDLLFHKVFGVYIKALTASIIALYISRKFDIFLYVRLNRLIPAQYISCKNVFSASISLFIDTFLVISLMSLFGVLPFDRQWPLIADNYIWKLFCTLVTTPIFYGAYRIIRYLMK